MARYARLLFTTGIFFAIYIIPSSYCGAIMFRQRFLLFRAFVATVGAICREFVKIFNYRHLCVIVHALSRLFSRNVWTRGLNNTRLIITIIISSSVLTHVSRYAKPTVT